MKSDDTITVVEVVLAQEIRDEVTRDATRWKLGFCGLGVKGSWVRIPPSRPFFDLLEAEADSQSLLTWPTQMVRRKLKLVGHREVPPPMV
jgi:hypothetical protein